LDRQTESVARLASDHRSAVIFPKSLKRFDLSSIFMPTRILTGVEAWKEIPVGAGHDRVPAETERDQLPNCQ